MADLLLKRGAIVNAANRVSKLRDLVYLFDNHVQFKEIPLHFACREGRRKIVELLLQYHANVNAKDVVSRKFVYV